MKAFFFNLILFGGLAFAHVPSLAAQSRISEAAAEQSKDLEADPIQACLCNCRWSGSVGCAQKGYYVKPKDKSCSLLESDKCLVTCGDPAVVRDGQLLSCEAVPKPIKTSDIGGSETDDEILDEILSELNWYLDR